MLMINQGNFHLNNFLTQNYENNSILQVSAALQFLVPIHMVMIFKNLVFNP